MNMRDLYLWLRSTQEAIQQLPSPDAPSAPDFSAPTDQEELLADAWCRQLSVSKKISGALTPREKYVLHLRFAHAVTFCQLCALHQPPEPITDPKTSLDKLLIDQWRRIRPSETERLRAKTAEN